MSTTAVKERPILMSAAMVRAILDGKKTQTRRIIKPQPSLKDRNTFTTETMTEAWQAGFVPVDCPYGNRGWKLWVRETWRCFGGPEYEYQREPKSIVFKATADIIDSGPWKPSIFMPRWACRIVLLIEEIRVERLQQISEEDCRKEGCSGGHDSIPDYPYSATPREHYRDIWTRINGKKGPRSWDADPFVWVVQFRRVL